jgi:hypothetical protein
MIKVLLLLSSIVFTIQQSFSLEHIEVRRSIIDSYMEGSPKELFKVFHYVFEKPYNLNSEFAIAKYRVFKKNLSIIKEHNSKGKSWTLEINFFADMTKEEIRAYMGIAALGTEESMKIESLVGDRNFDLFDDLVDREERRKLNEVSFFDQFAESDDDGPVPPTNSTFPEIDHSQFLTPPRSQGNCGSCWAFSATSAIEANYNIIKRKRNTTESSYISTQAILDCNAEKYGCDGGWMNSAMKTISNYGAVLDSAYPYEETQNSVCRNATTIRDLRFNKRRPIEGCAWTSWFDGFRPCTKASFYALLKKGPVSVVLNADDIHFVNYRSGTLDAAEIKGCDTYNHAVVAYAWSIELDEKTGVNREVIKIRNSWGSGWGDNGNVKYFYDDNGSCYITKMAFRPNLI